jgi:putative protease
MRAPVPLRPRKPEVLAPAGSLDALKAALAAGADAVYFGLQEGFNARARAGNFTLDGLPDTVARIHRAGARAYLTLNTLIFEPELTFVERVLRGAVAAGVDALIVQDPAVCVLARLVAPELELHASTQMTVSSPEGAVFARSLGCTRVVLPRELSVDEVRKFMEGSDVETEVFIHGALCVSWSGQCLTSEAWGGRSANRGECAQSCRMPYDLVVDGAARELGDVAYLLSPKDLAGLRAVPELAAIGVHGLKVEGRQKGPQYVATAVAAYRRLTDATPPGSAPPEAAVEAARRDLLATTLSYSRGVSDGFLAGSDHQTLVEGRFPKHRGVYLGRVTAVRGKRVDVARDLEGRPWTGALAADGRRTAPAGAPRAALDGFAGAADAASGPAPAEIELRAGMGVVFDDGEPEDKHEPGGPLFAVDLRRDGWTLVFGDPGPDLRSVVPGQRVWATNDPALTRATERLLGDDEPVGRVALDVRVEGRAGAPLRVVAQAGAFVAEAASNAALSPAKGGGLDDALLRDKLGALGGTPFRLEGCDASALEGGLHLPVSELKELRRRLVAELLPQVERGRVLALDPAPAVPRALAGAESVVAALAAVEAVGSARPPAAAEIPATPHLIALCRTDAQLDAAIAAGAREVELDWMEMVGLAVAVRKARDAGLRVVLATVRVQKPGEEAYDRRIAELKPDGVLVRHFGALVHFAGLPPAARPVLHGDFSLNVTNSVTAAELLRRGLTTLTASHDLDEAQLDALLERTAADRVVVVLHHRIATFHTEHCVYAHLLSEGRDFRTCGRPCESRSVALRDHRGREHPVIVDVGCRNTVFNAEVQSSASLVPKLIERGVRRFRVEFVRETRAEAARVLAAYGALLRGELTPAAAAADAGATLRTGVANSPMSVLV